MFSDRAKEVVRGITREIKEAGTWKEERLIASPQGVEIVVNGRKVVNFCANNYLGLSSHPEVLAASKQPLDQYGYGMSSVRFICGTQDQHRKLEKKLAEFFGFEDSILFGSCFDANGGIFEALLTEHAVIISHALNDASLTEGLRLCKAEPQRFPTGAIAERGR